MPRYCTVCASDKLAAIDDGILRKEPHRRLAERFGLSASAILRHATEHLPVAMGEELVAARQAPITYLAAPPATAPASEIVSTDTTEQVRRRNLLGRLDDLNNRTMNILEKAETEGRLETALKAIRESRGNTELIARVDGVLNLPPEGGTTLILSLPRVTVVMQQVFATARDGDRREGG
jgi:hypothetical protein